MCVVNSPAGGPSDNQRRLRRIVVAILLAGAAFPAHAGSGSGADTTSEEVQPAPEDQRGQEAIVTGQRLFGDIVPESDLDQQAIESYGVSTVDELLAEVQAELGEDEEPLIIVNGERLNSLDEIGAFPVEVLRNLQVLPRGSAIRLGGTSGQRVISLTLKPNTKSATITVAPKIATEGDWHSGRAEGLFTYLRGQTRANLGLRVRGESSLLESERDIIQPDPRLPFAQQGNVVGYPDTSGPIDPPFLTAPVAGVPNSANPALADFVARANQANVTSLGDFRTLRPRVRNYDLNGTFATRLAPWLTSNATFRFNRNVSRSLRGLPSALFRLPATNPASPFSTDVGLAYYGTEPLHSRSQNDRGEARLTFNGKFGRWISNFNASHSENKSTFENERQSTFGTVTIADAVNPFATDLFDMIEFRRDRSTSRTVTNLAQLSATGPLITLPAGPVQATIEGRLSWYSLKSHSTYLSIADRRLRRNEQSIRGALDVPLTSRISGVGAAIGDLSATAEYARIHYSDAGGLDHYALGLTWQPIDAIRLRGSIEETDRPASLQTLGNPVVETSDVRIFDPLTGETVDVLQITGGNPDIKPEKVKIRRLSGLFRLLPRYNLQLNAEYTDTDARNYISSLPPTSLAVMLAFPDRYVRSGGQLTTVDLTPVNFDTHREKRLRWGLSMRRKIGGGGVLQAPVEDSSAGEAEAGDEAETPAAAPPRRTRLQPSTYFQLTANHTVVFTDKLVIRPELDSVDLLGGGALGIGGGRTRHQVDGTAALTSGGLGVRMGVTWRGPSKLDTRIGSVSDTLDFDSLFLINLRAFADARRLFPSSDWAKGLRVSLNVVNATNERQRVRNSAGSTPLQYQPAYRDALGRTIEFEIRKVF